MSNDGTTGINDTMENYAKLAYNTYGDISGWKGLRGETILQWDLLHVNHQRVWYGVANALMERAIIAPKYTKVLCMEHIIPFTTI